MKNLLHQTRLYEFSQWLRLHDWSIEKTKGWYEVLRASHPDHKEKVIVYRKEGAKEHHTTFGIGNTLVKRFIADRRGIKETCGDDVLPALHAGQKPQGVV